MQTGMMGDAGEQSSNCLECMIKVYYLFNQINQISLFIIIIIIIIGNLFISKGNTGQRKKLQLSTGQHVDFVIL